MPDGPTGYRKPMTLTSPCLWHFQITRGVRNDRSVALVTCTLYKNRLAWTQYISCNLSAIYFIVSTYVTRVTVRCWHPPSNASFSHIYTASHKEGPLYFCPYLSQILTDFQIFSTLNKEVSILSSNYYISQQILNVEVQYLVKLLVAQMTLYFIDDIDDNFCSEQ
jgi:hypothetical protein